MTGIHGENQTDDFQAVIRVKTAAQGGRTAPVFNGIRWDLSYTPDGDLYMIWPDFKGFQSYEHNVALPLDQELNATLCVTNSKFRPLHRWMMREGTSFFMREGGRVVAEGVVTKRLNITNIQSDEPRLSDYGLPPLCAADIEKEKQLTYESSDCECGRVRLVRSDEIFEMQVRCESNFTRGIFRNPQRFQASLRAVNLIAEAEDYDPEFILAWLPELKKFATIDTAHFDVTVFQNSTWEDIVADPITFLESQWFDGSVPGSMRLDVGTLPHSRPLS